jgi:hypothetical protein
MMNTFELTIAVSAGALLTIIVIAAFVLSVFGKDLVIFNRYKTAAPTYYRNLRLVLQFNCPLAALISVVGIIGAPFLAVDPDGGMLLAVGVFVVSGIVLWLAARWFRWSLSA